MPRPTPDLRRRLFRLRLAAAEQEIAAGLETGRRDNPFRSLKRRVVIAHAPRVGSHLLCEKLGAYGVRAQEFFEAPRIHATAARRGLGDLEGYCRWLLSAHAANGIFGVSGGVKVLAPLTLTGELPRFASRWAFVYLTRDDFVAQAVSWLVLRRSGAFRSTATPKRLVSDADYDPGLLGNLVDAAMTVNAAWEGAFEVLGVTPLRLTYETLAADPAAVCADAARHLGLVFKGDSGEIRPRAQRQASELNETWIARFRREQPDFCRSRAAGEFEPEQGRRAPLDGGSAS